MSKMRKPVRPKASKKAFKSGTKTHVKNILGHPMRGGIRL